MATSIRGASQINDSEFLAAYNNKDYNNLQVMESLNTDWTAVGVKLRSPRVTLHTIVERTGGKSGTFTDRKSLSLEAQIWVKNGSIQQQPKSGGYVTLADRIAKGEITVDPTTLVITQVSGTAASTQTAASAPTTEAAASKPTATNTQAPTTEAAAPTGTTTQIAETTEAPAAPAFTFTAELFGQNYEFSGPTKEDAMNALFGKLQELNFSKVAITNLANRNPCGIGDIVNGGRYKFAKQLTAA